MAGKHTADSYLQVRVDNNDKKLAAEILEGLGTNLSSVVNMLLKQIILTKGIPFDVRQVNTHTKQELLLELKKVLED